MERKVGHSVYSGGKCCIDARLSPGLSGMGSTDVDESGNCFPNGKNHLFLIHSFTPWCQACLGSSHLTLLLPEHRLSHFLGELLAVLKNMPRLSGLQQPDKY